MSPCVFIFSYIERASLMAKKIKSSPAMQERPRLDPWVRKIPWKREWLTIPVGKGNGNPLQYSCLENSMDGRAW